MIVHIALFRWKEGTPSDDIQKSMDDVRALQQKVPGLIDIHCGENFSRWSEGFTHAFVILAESREALDAYRNHPDHQIVAAHIESMEEKSLGMDFED